MPNDFRVRSLLWRGLALPRSAHGRRFLKKAPAVSVGFWGSALLVPTAKGPRLLQTPSNGNLGLYRFPLSAPACIEVAVFIEFYVENHSLEKNSYMYLLCWGCVACGGERAAFWSQFFFSLWRSWGQTQCQSGLKAPLSAETPLYLFSVPHIAFPFVCPQVIIVLSELGRRVWAVRGLSEHPLSGMNLKWHLDGFLVSIPMLDLSSILDSPSAPSGPIPGLATSLGVLASFSRE